MMKADSALPPAVIRAIEADAERSAADPLLRAAAGASILVTGASGMIGSCLALAFAEADRRFKLGLEIYGLSRSMNRNAELFDGKPLHRLDRDVTESLSDLPRFDYIVHAASPVGPAIFETNPAGVAAANLKGTLNLLEKAARDDARRFLFVSTHEVYGAGKDVWREEDAGNIDFLSPRACYPESKRAGENACVCFHVQYGLHTGIARLSRAIGPGMNLDSGLFVCDFIKDALAGRDIEIKGDGNLIRPLIHASDAVAGLIKILFAGEPGAAYNIAPVEAPTILDTARIVAALADCGVRESAPGGPGGGATQDAGRLRGLGWKPVLANEDGLAKVWGALSAIRGVSEIPRIGE